MKKIDPNWKAGFATERQAIKAGEKWFTKANGLPGRLGRDFHISTNKYGLFHFEEGRGPSDAGAIAALYGAETPDV